MDHPPVVITRARCAYEREPLSTPLAFKGGAQRELWQAVVALRDEAGKVGVGIGTQGIISSDPEVFARYGEERGNALMFAVLEDAARRAVGVPFSRPGDLLDAILPGAIAKAQDLTGFPQLRLAFVLNALAALDNAAWQLHARSHATSRLDNLLDAGQRTMLKPLAKRLGIIAPIGQAVSLDEVRRLVTAGHRLLKVEIGSDPNGDGDPDAMLAWDIRRVDEVYRAAGDARLHLDARRRYDSPARLRYLLDHCRSIGASNRIVMLEEPFPEEHEFPVGDLGVRIAAGGSAQSDADVRRRIALGYGAIALNPAAGTLSMTLRMLAAAREANVPCFIADSTASPILVDWNKAIAARLPALPGLDTPVFETEGAQHYANWTQMQSYHPKAGASWTEVRDGGFDLDAVFYEMTGGIFQPPEHYRKLAEGA